MMEHWHWWTLVVLVLLIGEAFVPGLVLGSLAVGALAGALASLITDWWEYQFVAASVGSVMSLLFLRPLAMRKWFSGDSVATGVDALPGRTIRVTEAFDPRSGQGEENEMRRKGGRDREGVNSFWSYLELERSVVVELRVMVFR